MTGRAEKQGPIDQGELLEDGQGTEAQGTVYHIAVAGAERRQDELAQVLALAGVGVVLHAHVVGVELVPGDVGQQLGEVQPPQELHGVLRVRVASHRRARPSQQVSPLAVYVDGLLQELPQVT